MSNYSTNQAAKKLGIAVTSLDRYIAAKKVPAPILIYVLGCTDAAILAVGNKHNNDSGPSTSFP